MSSSKSQWCCDSECFLMTSFGRINVAQSLSHVQLFLTSWSASRQASLTFTISQSLLKLKSLALMMPSNHLIHCHPLLLLDAIFPSIRVFESALHIKWIGLIKS